jgi:hypothetical protein
MISVMPLDKGWHLIFRFAIAGFLLAMMAAFCMIFHAPNVITNLMILVSPGIWLFPHEAWGTALSVWLSFGFLAIANGVLYAIVGAAIVGLRRPNKKTA